MKKKNKGVKIVPMERIRNPEGVARQGDGSYLSAEQQKRLNAEIARGAAIIRFSAIAAMIVIAALALTVAIAYSKLSTTIVAVLAVVALTVVVAEFGVIVYASKRTNRGAEKIKKEAETMQDDLRDRYQSELTERKRRAAMNADEQRDKAYREAMQLLQSKRKAADEKTRREDD